MSEEEEDPLVHIECPPDALDPTVPGSSTEVEVDAAESAGRRVTLEQGPAQAGPIRNPWFISSQHSDSSATTECLTQK